MVTVFLVDVNWSLIFFSVFFCFHQRKHLSSSSSKYRKLILSFVLCVVCCVILSENTSNNWRFYSQLETVLFQVMD